MRLRRYRPEDFATLQGWIADRREHALWCADRFSYPLAQEDFHRVLAAAAVEAGETPFILCDDDGLALGFFCYSQDNGVGKLRFVILAPALRGKGLGKMLLHSALGYAFGAAGAELRRENAEATAELLNAAKPFLIFTGTVHADPGCPLYEDMQSGAFTEPTFGEYLEEEALLLDRLTLENTYFFGVHPSNVLPMRGVLPRDREAMLEAIRERRAHMGSRLNERPIRTGEGGILNRG